MSPANPSLSYFRADNRAIRIVPKIVVSRRLSEDAKKSLLTPTDAFMILGCFAKLDERYPLDPVKTSYGEMFEILQFIRVATGELSDELDRHSWSQYGRVRDSLFRLYTTELHLSRRSKERGRPIVWDFRSHVFSNLGFGYASGDDPNLCPKEIVKNVGTDDRPILLLRKQKPIFIQFQIDRLLLEGLHEAGEHFTLINRRFFSLRSFLNNHATAIRLAFWLLGQAEPVPEISPEKLLPKISGAGHDPSRASESVETACALLQRSGAIVARHIRPRSRGAGEVWCFEKSPDFFYLGKNPVSARFQL